MNTHCREVAEFLGYGMETKNVKQESSTIEG
jgi:hypothetical protein